MKLPDIIKLADAICDYSYPDERPSWLKERDDGYHPRPGTKECAMYYKFLYALVKIVQPPIVVELGAGAHAISALHIAAGSPTSRVTTVDTSPDMLASIKEAPVTNLEGWVGHSLDLFPQFASQLPGLIDLFFLDTSHVYGETVEEYRRYRTLVRRGGIMLFDDIVTHLDPSAFYAIDEPKYFHNKLHDTCGFVIAIKK